MKLKKMHWFGIIASAVILIISVFFFWGDQRMFLFMTGISLGVAALPFIIGFTMENKEEQKINEMFLEFSRNLAESVATGTPVSKAIINMKKKNYGILNQHIKKLANQIELGIPIERAMETFANDVDNDVVKRATALINEAERSGGEIDYILDSTAKSISEVDKLKKERKTTISNLIVQGYVIFFIFIGIIIIMEFKIIPLTSGIGDFGGFGASGISDLQRGETSNQNASGFSPEDFTMPLFALLLSQGIFMGLVIGKLTEGTLRGGIKHSLILSITAFLISGAAKLFAAPV